MDNFLKTDMSSCMLVVQYFYCILLVFESCASIWIECNVS